MAPTWGRKDRLIYPNISLFVTQLRVYIPAAEGDSAGHDADDAAGYSSDH
jgi:hypothetical protein